MFRLDWISCFLTVLSTLLIGRRLWHGWVIAGINSVVVCVIGVRTAQFGFVPANVLCLGLYALNLRAWRLKSTASQEPSEYD
jgi:hypothetical protein